MTTRKLKPYGLRQFGSSVFLPPDVMQALDEPPGRRQGRLLIWAATARAAYEHAEKVGLGGIIRNSRELSPAMGYDVETLDAAYPWAEGTVLAYSSNGVGPVIEIARLNDAATRTLRHIGHIGRPQRPIFTPADMSMAVTDDMVDAARAVLADYEETLPIREAIAAALQEWSKTRD